MHLGKSGRDKASLYNDYSIRWAKSFNNKFAFKLSAQYISADDWLASDTSNYLRSGTSGKLIPGNRATDPNYDGVNVYGDETSINMLSTTQTIQSEYSQGIEKATGGMIPDVVAMLNSIIPANSSYTDAVNIINGVFAGPLDPLKPTVRDRVASILLGVENNLVPGQNVSRTGYQEKDVIDPENKKY